MTRTSIVIDITTKQLVDNFYYSIKASLVKKSRERLTWDDFMGKIFNNATIVGGTVLECKAIF